MLRTRVGLTYMLTSGAMFAVMGVCAYAASLISPDTSSLVTSFVRMLVNLLIIVFFATVTRQPGLLWGDLRPSLFLRGLFGAVAVMLSFASIKSIGIGDSAFLHSSNGFFIALLSPLVLKQKNSLVGWLAIIGGLIGLYFLLGPRTSDLDQYGRTFGVLSGFFSAFAYLMVARAGRSNEAVTVVFFHCIISTIAHLAIFPWVDLNPPSNASFWGFLIMAGVSGTVAQHFMTKAYRYAPATLNAAVSYSNPVVNMILGALIFAKFPDTRGIIGAAIVLLAGIVLPFAAASRRAY